MRQSGDKWPVIFLIVMITLFAGVPIAILSIFFFSQNVEKIATIIGVGLVVSLAVSLIIVRYRNAIAKIAFGQRLQSAEELAQSFSNTISSALRGDKVQTGQEASNLARSIGAQYAWIQTRKWMIGTLVAFGATFAALAGAALLYKQNELFEQELGALRDQFELERTRLKSQRRTELISYLWDRKNGKPISNARTRREALVEFINLSMSSDLKFEGKVDLREAQLSNLDLRGIDFSKLDVRGTNFQEATLSGITAKGVNFEGANLSGVNSIGSNFSNGNFRDTCIVGATFAQSVLSSADFVGSNLKGTNFYQSKLENAQIHDLNLYRVDFYEADLSQVEIYDADVREANFTDSNIKEKNINGDTRYCRTIMPNGTITTIESHCDEGIPEDCS